MANKKLEPSIFAGKRRLEMKSRKGAALVMALVIVIVGGAIIGVTFNLVFRHVWMSVQLRGGYVDSTILRSAIEEVRGRITARNMTDGIQHVPVVTNAGVITGVNQLRFNPADFPAPPGGLVLNQPTEIRAGVGTRFVLVEVYDLRFQAQNVVGLLRGTLPNPIPDFFPPSFFSPVVAGGGGNPMAAFVEGEAITSGGGGTGGVIDQGIQGVYMVRARLFDADPGANVNADTRPIREAREVFEQILPPIP